MTTLFHVYLVKSLAYFEYAGFLGVEIWNLSICYTNISKAAEFLTSNYPIDNF